MDSEEKPHVMVVDDVPTNVKILSHVLHEEFTVSTATSGAQCLARSLLVPQPDLILLDVMMPEMDGIEVCQQLKADPRTEHIPVIFVSAMDDVHNEEVGFKAGAVDYISKPFGPAIVLARIKIHLELCQHRQRLQKELKKTTRNLKLAESALLTKIRRE